MKIIIDLVANHTSWDSKLIKEHPEWFVKGASGKIIASAKAGLVLAFFMHLKYEGRFLKAMLTLTVSALTLLIGLTFVDVWYR